MTSSATDTVPSYRDFRVSVKRLDRLSPSFLRVTFGGDELAQFGDPGPDHRIKVILPIDGIGFTPLPRDHSWYEAWRALPPEQQNPIRTYTVREARPDQQELDVDFVLHGATGPASAWAETCGIGDELIVIGPNAAFDGLYGGFDFHPPADARQLLIAGDETAVPAIANIVAALPSDATGVVVLEVPDRADHWEISAPAGVTVRWLSRDGGRCRGEELIPLVCRAAAQMVHTPAAASTLEDVDVDVDLLWDSPEEPVSGGDGLYAWFAGEAGMVKTLRRHLVSELGVDRRSVAFLGYWRMGKAETN